MDEILAEANQVKETDHIYQDIIDDAYLEEFREELGDSNQMVRDLQQQQEMFKGKSMTIGSLIQEEKKVIKEQKRRVRIQNKREAVRKQRAETRRAEKEGLFGDIF